MLSTPTLVTGATGGLGRVLVSTLRAAGRTVVATGRARQAGQDLATTGARFVPLDLVRDDLAPLFDGVGTVFHLAALSSPWGTEQAFVEANVVATRRLLAAARARGCGAFVFTATPSIYARPADQLGLTEASPLPTRLANAYARTKLAAERLVLAADGGGFRTVVLRPRAIIGPHDRVLLPRLLRATEQRWLLLPRGGRALIEPTDARDVVGALLAAERRLQSVGGRVFNVSGGVPVTLERLVARVCQRLRRPLRTISVPARLVLALGALSERLANARSATREPLLTRYGAMTLGWSQTFDLSAARAALDWTPCRHPMAAVDWALSEMAHA